MHETWLLAAMLISGSIATTVWLAAWWASRRAEPATIVNRECE